MLPAIGDVGGKVFGAGHGASGIIRIVEPHYLSCLGDFAGNGRQIGQPAILLPQRHYVTLGAGKHRSYPIDWVCRIRNQGNVAGVQEAKSHVADTFLGTNQGQDFLIRVKIDAKSLFVPLSDGPSHFRKAIGFRIAVVGRVLRRGEQPVNYRLRSRNIRVTNTKSYDISAFSTLFSDDPGDFNKRIGSQLAQATG